MVQPEGVQSGAPDVVSTDAAGASVATCPWCAAPAAADAPRCPSCGAALAQREAIGDLLIPGLTSVDPALQDYDRRPLHLRGPSPSQGMAPALIVGAIAGGPVGFAAIGGVAAVAAAEFLGAGRGGAGGTSAGDLDSVGRPSEIVLQALDRLEDDPARPPASEAAGEPGTESGTIPGVTPPRPADDDGRSIWRDLPRAEDPGPTREEDGTHG